MKAIHAIGLTLAALLASAAHGSNGEQIDASVDALKREYLACDRSAMSGQLSSGGIMHCSIVYEELKRRAFGGDFDKLLVWSNSQQPASQIGASHRR